jgi:hypothetical protein
MIEESPHGKYRVRFEWIVGERWNDHCEWHLCSINSKFLSLHRKLLRNKTVASNLCIYIPVCCAQQTALVSCSDGIARASPGRISGLLLKNLVEIRLQAWTEDEILEWSIESIARSSDLRHLKVIEVESISAFGRIFGPE